MLTTSRRTSNRVRSFIRDLSIVLPQCERFNRGSITMAELFSRIRQSGAKAAIVVSMYKGNPGRMHIYSCNGTEQYIIQLRSVILRREVAPDYKMRVNELHSISIPYSASQSVIELGEIISSLVSAPFVESDIPISVGEEGRGCVSVRISSDSHDNIIWTHYHAQDAHEIGPRMVISSIRRPE